MDSNRSFILKYCRHLLRQRLLLLLALLLSIPAFYLILAGISPAYRGTGRLLYCAMALLLLLDLLLAVRPARHGLPLWRVAPLELCLLAGALASTWLSSAPWSAFEWLLRTGFCAVVFLHLVRFMISWIKRRRLLQILLTAIVLLAVAGAGFYWLEPRVLTYADGLWLAFITGATVGYGDLVPSTPGSRIFAVFIVLLGYALFSVVTASIAALFVGEDEKRFERELHADIRCLREEIAQLRKQLNS